MWCITLEAAAAGETGADGEFGLDGTPDCMGSGWVVDDDGFAVSTVGLTTDPGWESDEGELLEGV